MDAGKGDADGTLARRDDGDEKRNWDETKTRIGRWIGTALVAGGVVGLVVAITIPAMGFLGAGIAAGTVAAAIQSSIGNVAAGSAFAALQSIGATGGVPALAAAAGGVTSAAVITCAGLTEGLNAIVPVIERQIKHAADNVYAATTKFFQTLFKPRHLIHESE